MHDGSTPATMSADNSADSQTNTSTSTSESPETKSPPHSASPASPVDDGESTPWQSEDSDMQAAHYAREHGGLPFRAVAENWKDMSKEDRDAWEKREQGQG